MRPTDNVVVLLWNAINRNNGIVNHVNKILGAQPLGNKFVVPGFYIPNNKFPIAKPADFQIVGQTIK